jgi:predicted acylesterase/phospholipase RssA
LKAPADSPGAAAQSSFGGAPRIGLALAGGGPLGAIHEIGALCALQEALEGVELDKLSAYVGVSAGAFVAAGLANGITPRQMCLAFIENDGSTDDRVDPSMFIRPAWGEYLRRAATVPALLLRSATRLLSGRGSLLASLELLGRALPAGAFSTAAMQAQVHRLLSAPGRSDDFRRSARWCWSRPTWTAARPCRSASPAGTMCRSRRRRRPARRCRGCSRRCRSTAAGSSTAR